MMNKKLKKLLFAVFTFSAVLFSLSICASAAQIENLSVENGVLRALISGENSAIYAASYDGRVLASVSFAESDKNGFVSMNVPDGECSLFVWDKTTLAPLSAPYTLKNGSAYAEGSAEPVAPFTAANVCRFDQSAKIVIVTSVSDRLITGQQNGVVKEFPLANDAVVFNLPQGVSNGDGQAVTGSAADIVPGCVILPSIAYGGVYYGAEILASVGCPLDNAAAVDTRMGEYNPSDGTTAYKNVFGRWKAWGDYFSTDQPEMNMIIYADGTVDGARTANYRLLSKNINRVTLTVENDAASVTIENRNAKINTLGSTPYNHNYFYLRMNTATGFADEAVLFIVPSGFEIGKGDDEYSDIFSVDTNSNE